MKNYFEKEFELRFFEMNHAALATPTSMLMLLEETAADHCQSINYGLYDLIKQNVGWVLVSGRLEMYEYPAYKEKIIIRTWLSSYSSIRENIIYNSKRKIIGKAKGLWLFFDIKKRKPIRIFEEIMNKWSFCKTQSIAQNINTKISPTKNADFTKEFYVNRFDTDMNKHVSNIKYLHWLMESLPEKITLNNHMTSIDGRFTAEAHIGNTIISQTEIDKEDPYKLIHSIKIKDTQQICAIANTTWYNKLYF